MADVRGVRLESSLSSPDAHLSPDKTEKALQYLYLYPTKDLEVHRCLGRIVYERSYPLENSKTVATEVKDLLTNRPDLLRDYNSRVSPSLKIEPGANDPRVPDSCEAFINLTVGVPLGNEDSRECFCLELMPPGIILARTSCCKLISHADCLSRWARENDRDDHFTCPKCRRRMQGHKFLFALNGIRDMMNPVHNVMATSVDVTPDWEPLDSEDEEVSDEEQPANNETEDEATRSQASKEEVEDELKDDVRARHLSRYDSMNELQLRVFHLLTLEVTTDEHLRDFHSLTPDSPNRNRLRALHLSEFSSMDEIQLRAFHLLTLDFISDEYLRVYHSLETDSMGDCLRVLHFSALQSLSPRPSSR